jgi:hypothetical protein
MMADANETTTDQDALPSDVITVGISASYANPSRSSSVFTTYTAVTIHDPAATSWLVHAYNETQDVRYFLKDYKRKAPALRMLERLGRHLGVEPVIDYRAKARK